MPDEATALGIYICREQHAEGICERTRGTWRDNECVQVQEEQRASKSTICSRILGRALFPSLGAISCSYSSFGASAPFFNAELDT